ncbi:MAG: acireductone synthase [Terracidiphilus sp.]
MTFPRPRLYLLDVEGTVAPISLVYEQLFPYARAHIADFLKQNSGDADITADLALLAVENRAELDAPRFNDATDSERAVAYLNWLMDQDRKSTALKSLQGRIWKSGFESGELKGVLFDDVPAALDRWNVDGQVAIYSSGSVDAQRLLFRYSIFGDLTERIAAHFDTRVGPKTAGSSYTTIAAAMNLMPSQVLFLSDVVRELDPAREAGFDTRLVVREGNAPVAEPHGHIAIDSFDCMH